MSRIRNAVVKSAKIGFEDHGALVILLDFDLGGTGQGVMISCESPEIKKLLRLFEVSWFSEVAKQPCRIEGPRTNIMRIGHFFKDQWFDVP